MKLLLAKIPDYLGWKVICSKSYEKLRGKLRISFRTCCFQLCFPILSFQTKISGKSLETMFGSYLTILQLALDFDRASFK